MRKNISGGSPYEPIIGFSRAVRVENRVYVAGTAPVGAENEDAAGQTRRVFAIAEKALAEAGASFQHVVRTRIFLTHVEDWEMVGRCMENSSLRFDPPPPWLSLPRCSIPPGASRSNSTP
jgi:enamine deaminase RidA (YjgF/YER057c/UK114 family)